MDKEKKYGIIKSACIAAACVCAAGVVTGFTIGWVGSHFGMKANDIARENGYDVANANYIVERITAYTDMLNQGFISPSEYRAELNNVKNLSYDTFISESTLSEDIKMKYSSLKEKQKSFEPAFAAVAGVIPFAFLVSGAVVNNEDYKKAKYERKQEKTSKVFVDNNIQL